MLEHKGFSFRTGQPLNKPMFFAIRKHSEDKDHTFTNLDFEILTYASNKLDLVISESLLIRKMKPQINSNSSAFQLSIQ